MFALALAESWRRVRRRINAGGGRLRISGPAPERLLLAPPDLHTGDPTVAQDIYAGQLFFAGENVTVGGTNPFEQQPPTIEWQRQLNSFRWLRHMAAAQNALSSSHARSLVRDWLAINPRPKPGVAWEVETTATRLIAWLCHSVTVVDGAELPEYRQFMKAIGQHVRYLRSTAPQAPDGVPLLMAYIALAYADVCIGGKLAGGAQAKRNLDSELERQILPDGGHISRNPAVLPPLLALLLPLRQSQARLGHAPSTDLVSAVERMMPAIRFFRMGDGSFARFNGVSVTPNDLIATILRYDDALGEPPESASFSRYERINRSGSVLLADTGAPPRGELSNSASAGCLSFELSDGTAPLIVNCGYPPNADGETAKLSRMTAAHSTVTMNDTSSCRFSKPRLVGDDLESRILSGPSSVRSKRDEDADSVTIEASHDGYVRDFGMVHERMLKLAADGGSLMGMDRLVTPDGNSPAHTTKDDAAIRFHLHPTVEIIADDGQQSITLKTAGGQTWIFTCIDARPEVEESVFFASAGGPRSTQQICLHANVSEHNEVRWIFERRS